MDHFYDLNFYGTLCSFTIKKSVQNILQKCIYYYISYGMGMQPDSWKAPIQLQPQSNTSELANQSVQGHLKITGVLKQSVKSSYPCLIIMTLFS